MARVEYTLDERVALVVMNDDENRFNPDFLSAFLGVMDEIEQQTDALTVVVKSAHPKIWSNGIDLDWLGPVVMSGDTATPKAFLYQLNEVFKRLLTCPMLTVAAITGHAFAGGAILSCAFDFRYMRSDRGFFCFPEVDISIPFLPGMIALSEKAIPKQKFDEIKLTGARLTADECAAAGFVRGAVHIDTLMDEVMAFAKGLNKQRPIIGEMKARLARNILKVMEEEDRPHIESGQLHIG